MKKRFKIIKAEDKPEVSFAKREVSFAKPKKRFKIVKLKPKRKFKIKAKDKLSKYKSKTSVITYPKDMGDILVYYPAKCGSEIGGSKCKVRDKIASGKIWESKITKKIFESTKPGTIAIDVGANLGAHTISMLKGVGKTGKVIAFEPQDRTRASLTRTLKNLGSNVRVSDKIVYSKNGKVRFASNMTGMSRVLTESEKPPSKKWNVSEAVPAITLDTFLSNNIKPVSIIKIDVEGSELEVLKGAKKLIKKWRPTIFLEVWNPKEANTQAKKTEYLAQRKDVIKWAKDNNYRKTAILSNDWKLTPI
tara:strand:+ start:98 stop:1012 length:915 start_codon:yes stop_codon:yes gene_type:complete